MSWWVKDHITTLQWEWFTDVPTAHFWEYVRLKANREDTKWQGKVIPRGSFLSSVSHMSIESGLSEKQVRLAISKLEKTGEITTERTNRYTIINVVKYAKYQGCYDDEGEPMDTQKVVQTAEPREEQRATIKEDKNKDNKNIKKEIYKERKFSKPTLDEVRAYCAERNKGVDAQKWYAYYEANGFRVGRNPMRDWKACIRYWERHTDVSTSEDKLPTYDASNNKVMSQSEREELLKLMAKA